MAQAPLPCDLCLSENNASFYCIQCNLRLCIKCKTIHLTGRRTKNDTIIPLTEANQDGQVKYPAVLCEIHPAEELTLFCKQCDKFICTQCTEEYHEDHRVTTLKKGMEMKAEKINDLKRQLQEKKKVYDDVLKAELDVHTQYTDCIEKRRNEIQDQKEKIIEEFIEDMNILCGEYFSELDRLQQHEDTRHTTSCSAVKTETNMLTAGMKSLETSLDNPVTMAIVTENVSGEIQGLHQPKTPTMTKQKFKEENINRDVILRQMLTKGKGAIPKQRPPGGNIDGDKGQTYQQRGLDTKTQLDASKLRKLSTIKVKGKEQNIRVILPSKDNTYWVASNHDANLSLVDRDGIITKESVKESLEIDDAKQYKKSVIVTYYKGHKVNKMSVDGQHSSVFSNLHPSYTRRLCITAEMDVLVCLRSSTNTEDNKVVRLGSSGEIIQTIQYNSKGHPLYCDPVSVTSLPTGEVVVADYTIGIVCVDREGQHVFTWRGESGEDETFKASYVTHDDYGNLYVANFNNDKVYVLGKDGTGGRCVLDKPHGLYGPAAVTLDNNGHLLVGCWNGEILEFGN